MKRIVILCDGTWNAAEAPDPTNVVRIGQALAPYGADGQAQVPIYVEGVGTGRRGVTTLGRMSDRFLGGALGLGLMENVVEAYRHLIFLYEPGDEVYIFGFSRGAFTARSLVGFIRFNGLLARADLFRLPEAVRRYTQRRIESPERRQRRNAEWRARFSPWVMTDPDDADVYAEFGSDQAVPFDVAFLGIWDTVGALGVPGILTAAPLINRKYAFHDTDLSTMVRAARHAVALDERRTSFRPTLWANLDDLNRDRDDRPYRQEFFPGDHGGVGGGGPVKALSALTLGWIMDGSCAAGLEWDAMVEADIRSEGDATGPLANSEPPNGGLVASLMRRFGAARGAVGSIADVSYPARQRWSLEGKGTGFKPYRPEPLTGLTTHLQAWKDDQARDEA